MKKLVVLLLMVAAFIAGRVSLELSPLAAAQEKSDPYEGWKMKWAENSPMIIVVKWPVDESGHKTWMPRTMMVGYANGANPKIQGNWNNVALVKEFRGWEEFMKWAPDPDKVLRNKAQREWSLAFTPEYFREFEKEVLKKWLALEKRSDREYAEMEKQFLDGRNKK